MLGNLLDNAFKWCRRQVRVHGADHATHKSASACSKSASPTTARDSDDTKARVLLRGARADETTPGHGLGLAMVQDTVALYHGALSLQTSPLGGLKNRSADSRAAALNAHLVGSLILVMALALSSPVSPAPRLGRL